MQQNITISLPIDSNVTIGTVGKSLFDIIVHILYMREQIPENYETLISTKSDLDEKMKMKWIEKVGQLNYHLQNALQDFGERVSAIHLFIGNSIRSSKEQISIYLPRLQQASNTVTKSNITNIVKRNLCNYWSEVSISALSLD